MVTGNSGAQMECKTFSEDLTQRETHKEGALESHEHLADRKEEEKCGPPPVSSSL